MVDPTENLPKRTESCLVHTIVPQIVQSAVYMRFYRKNTGPSSIFKDYAWDKSSGKISNTLCIMTFFSMMLLPNPYFREPLQLSKDRPFAWEGFNNSRFS